MNIATLGVAIDPTPASQGAAAATAALDKISAAAGRTSAATAKASQDTGKAASAGAAQHVSAFDRMLEGVRRFFGGYKASERAASETGKGAFGSVIQAVIGSLQQMLAFMPGINSALLGMGLGAANSAAGLGTLAGAGVAANVALLPLMATIGVIAAGLLAFAAAFVIVKKSISAAAEMETATNGFAVLLGSVEAAKARMQELSKFAADTPFELPDIVTASRQLEIFTKGALSTGEGLVLVGDAASQANQSFSEMAMPIGRAYAALMGGSPVGEALESLRRFGVVTIETSNRLQEMQKQGLKGAEVWKVLEADIKRAAGTMKIQSQSWTGLLSTAADSVGALFRAFGEPILDQLKPLLAGWITGLGGLEKFAGSVGQSVANAIATIRGLFASGTIGEAFGLSLQIGGTKAINFMVSALFTALAMVGPLLIIAAKAFIGVIELLGKPTFWVGMGKQLFAIAADFGTRLLSVFATPIAIFQAKMEGVLITLQNGFNEIFGGDKIDFNEAAAIAGYKNAILGMAGANREAIAKMYEEAKTDLSSAFAGAGDGFKAEMSALWEATKETFAQFGEFIPTDKLEAASARMKEILEAARQLGTAPAANINKMLPGGAGAAGGLIEGETAGGDKWKSKIETDAMVMREYRKEFEALMKAEASVKERSRIGLGLKQDAVNKLQDPNAYADELGQWRTFQQEKLLAAKQTDQMIEQGFASSSQSMQRGLQKSADAFGNMQQSIVKGTEGMTQIMSQSMGNALGEWVTGAKSAKDAFRDMLIDMLNGIAKLIMQLLVEYAVRQAIKAVTGYATGGSVPNGGNVAGYSYNSATGYTGYAVGGQVTGGRGGIDDIPAMLTAGEFVIPRDAVNHYGLGFLEDVRAQRVERYATGGSVGAGRGGASDGGSRGISVVVNVDAKSDGSKGNDKERGEKLGKQLEGAIMQVIVREKRAGGILAEK